MPGTLWIRSVLTLAAVLFGAHAWASSTDVPSPLSPRDAWSDRTHRAVVARLPLAFEVNRGQAPEDFDFLVRCGGYRAFVAPTEVVFAFEGAGLCMRLDGAWRTAPDARGRELPGRVNYFLGNDPEKWLTGVPLVRGVTYRDVAPGTSWTFRGSGRALEFTFDLAPDAAAPRLRFAGATDVRLAPDGGLRLGLPRGVAAISAPRAWQDLPDGRVPVPAAFAVEADGSVRVAARAADPSRPVHVDPTVTYESYLGANSEDICSGAGVDAYGAAYFGGHTSSTDFPTTTGAYDRALAGQDGFVTKVSSDGASLVWSTYIGGTGGETLYGLALDPSGNAWVSGSTNVGDYPTTGGVYRMTWGGGTAGRGVLTCIDRGGSRLVFSTYTQYGRAEALALSPSPGVAYVIENEDLSRYSGWGTAQDFHTSLYPTQWTYGESMNVRGVASDPDGNALVVGGTSSLRYPATAGAYQTTRAASSYDAYITKFDSTGGVVFTTYLGGTGSDDAYAVGVNAAGQVYVAGSTSSTDFPVTSGAYMGSVGAGLGRYVGFTTRLNATGSALRYSTYVPGEGRALSVHPTSVWCVGGLTEASLTLTGGFQSSPGGQLDGFVLRFHRDNSVDWASYCGGSSADNVAALGMGADGTLAVAGHTYSTDLPTVSPYQSAKGADRDSFILKIPDTLPTSVDPIVITTTSLPTWTVGYEYDPQQLAATGGIAPYVWTRASGSLPTGATLSSDGVVSGPLSATGTFTFTVRTEDATELGVEKQFSIRVNSAPWVAVSRLPDATLGTPYGRQVPVADGSGTMSFSVVEGSPPPDVTLGADGTFTGTPSQIGDFTFSVRVVDGRGAEGTAPVSVRVNQRPVMTAASLPDWTEGRPYEFQFAAGLGSGGFAWEVADGTLPTTTPIDPALGRLDGPAQPAGAYAFTLRATDSAGASVERAFTATIRPWPQITTTSLPVAAIGRPYSATLARTGGTPPYTWLISGGLLPDGMAMGSPPGRVVAESAGPTKGPVTFRCTDAAGATTVSAVAIPTAVLLDLTKKKSSEKVAVVPGSGVVRRCFEVTAGALLSVTVKGGAVGATLPAVRLHDSAGQSVDLGAWTTSTPKQVVVKGWPAPATGRWFLEVEPAATFDGALKLSVKIAPRSTWAFSGEVGPETLLPFAFSAPPGARLSISAKSPRDSAAVPRLVSVLGPGDVDLVPGGRTTDKRTSVAFGTKVPLEGGDYRGILGARDDGVGPIEWTVKLRLPRSYAFALDDVPAGD